MIRVRREEARWIRPKSRCGRLILIPVASCAPNGRITPSSTLDRTRCGSWSTTSSAARRCRGSTRSRSAGSPKACRRPAPLRPTDSAEPSKQCDGFAPSPTRWASAGSTSPPPKRCAAPPMDPPSPLQSARRRDLRFASCRAPKRRDTPRSASSPDSFARSERSATWAAAASRWPRRSTIVSETTGSVCRSARCRSRRC